MCKRFGVHVEEKIDFNEFIYFMEHGGEQCSSPSHAGSRRKKRHEKRDTNSNDQPVPAKAQSPQKQRESKDAGASQEMRLPEDPATVAGISNQEPSPQKPDVSNQEQAPDETESAQKTEHPGGQEEGTGDDETCTPIIEGLKIFNLLVSLYVLAHGDLYWQNLNQTMKMTKIASQKQSLPLQWQRSTWW